MGTYPRTFTYHVYSYQYPITISYANVSQLEATTLQFKLYAQGTSVGKLTAQCVMMTWWQLLHRCAKRANFYILLIGHILPKQDIAYLYFPLPHFLQHRRYVTTSSVSPTVLTSIGSNTPQGKCEYEHRHPTTFFHVHLVQSLPRIPRTDTIV